MEKEIKFSQIDVMRRFYCPHMDAHLILGKFKKDPKSLKQYVVGWKSRHHEALVENRFYQDVKSAQKTFKKLALDEDIPDHDHFQKDWQQDDVYDWENKFLMPYASVINEEEARKLLKKISRDYGIKTPKIDWEKFCDYSDYDVNDRIISFGHRDNISLLHEMAHVIYLDHHEDKDVSNHPPAFVWIALELYNRYAGLDLNYMIISANNKDVLGDIEENQQVSPQSLAPQNKNPPKPS